MFGVTDATTSGQTGIPVSPMSDDDRAAFLAAWPVSRETEARLERYAQLLRVWNQGLSLISQSTTDLIWTRHFLDSAQLAPLFPNPDDSIVDVGSGAGFPGLVLAIMGLPRIHLVEHNMRKIAFLKTVAAELSLNVEIHGLKAEAEKPFQAVAVTARALKPLDQLLGMVRNFVGPQTVCVFPKGRNAEVELTEAQRHWRMDVERFPSRTSPDSTIFRLSNISALGAGRGTK